MFGNTNQNKKNQKGSVDKKKDIMLNFLKSKDGKQIVQQFAMKQAFIDEKFISQNVLFPTQNTFFNMFSIPFEACKHLSTFNLSTLKNVWPGLNSEQSVKLLPAGETPENTNNSGINKKESLLDTINKIKNKVKSENEDNKNPTDFYNDQNSFEK